MLVQRHFDKVHGLAFKMTCSESAADDISQEVFLKVVSAIEKFEGKSLFSTWLYRIAMNTIYSYLKKESRQAPSLGEDTEFALAGTATSDQIALESELAREIESRIQKLKPPFRAAIVLTAFQGLSPGEAAEVEGCTAKTFYWRLHQARTQLKQELNRYLKS